MIGTQANLEVSRGQKRCEIPRCHFKSFGLSPSDPPIPQIASVTSESLDAIIDGYGIFTYSRSLMIQTPEIQMQNLLTKVVCYVLMQLPPQFRLMTGMLVSREWAYATSRFQPRVEIN